MIGEGEKKQKKLKGEKEPQKTLMWGDFFGGKRGVAKILGSSEKAAIRKTKKQQPKAKEKEYKK